MNLEGAEGRSVEIAAAREEIQGAAAAYARARLPRLLEVPAARFNVRPATAGLRSLVFFVEVDGVTRHVLRLVRRRDDARWLAAAVDLFAARGLPSPAPAARDTGLWARWRWGWSAFVEALAPGEPLGPSTAAAAVAAMGRAYAAVHAVRSRGWGRVDAPHVGGFAADRRRRMLALATEARGAASPSLRPGIDRLLEAMRDTPPEPAEFSLCHNRVTPTNVLLTASGGCLLIDLERVKYGSHLQELANLETDVFAGDATRFQIFLASYSAAVAVELQPASHASDWLWYRMLAGLKRLRGLSARGCGPDAESYLRSLASL